MGFRDRLKTALVLAVKMLLTVTVVLPSYEQDGAEPIEPLILAHVTREELMTF